jgi:hypothetical protein
MARLTNRLGFFPTEATERSLGSVRDVSTAVTTGRTREKCCWRRAPESYYFAGYIIIIGAVTMVLASYTRQRTRVRSQRVVEMIAVQ